MFQPSAQGTRERSYDKERKKTIERYIQFLLCFQFIHNNFIAVFNIKDTSLGIRRGGKGPIQPNQHPHSPQNSFFSMLFMAKYLL
jgi:hypothetical protein